MQLNSPRQTSVLSAVIASICIVVYLAALIITAVRIYSSVDQRSIAADREFYDLADIATSAGVLGFMDEAFIETIKDALTASKTLEAVIISGPNGEYAFEKKQDAAIRWVNNSPRFRKRFDLSPQPLSRSLSIQGLRNVNIQAVAGALDYGLLSHYLKTALIMVLAALALAFFTLLVESLASGARHRSFTEPILAGDTHTNKSFRAGNPHAEHYSHPIKPKPEAPPAEQSANRLDSELNRCAAENQDLVFIKMECKNSVNSGFCEQLMAEAPIFFAPRGLIGKRGERSVDLIYPHIDLETGFTHAEEFHRYLLNKYPDILASKTDLCMGLSSRSGRLIDSERLMFEAGEALNRALQDPVSCIVAFKSDPEKYRAYISRNH
jgi:hypothetical protein